MTSISMGFTAEVSGTDGSSAWVDFHVSTARNRIIRTGTVQTTASTLLEWDQSGVYFAVVFVARYFG